MTPKKLRQKIIKAVWANKWDDKCRQALKWLQENGETDKIDEYRSKTTTDEYFLTRSPRHNNHRKRIGTKVAEYPGNPTWHRYFYREAAVPPFDEVAAKIKPLYQLSGGCLVMDGKEEVYYVSTGGGIHRLKPPNAETARKLLDGYNPELVFKQRIRNKKKQLEIMSILTQYRPEYRIHMKLLYE